VFRSLIASLNGISSGGWIEQAGADALELNLYYVSTDLDVTGVKLEKAYI